jgi:cation transport regulator ChaB
MTENSKKEKITNCHKQMSSYCFNSAWDYMEKAERSPEDDEMMLFAAMAS